MELASLLQHTVLEQATVAAGAAALSNEVAWVHMVDHPDIFDWVDAGQLLLTTGYHWPREADRQREMIARLRARGLAGVVLAVPKFLAHFPPAAIDEADRQGLPLLELPWEIPFSQVTEQIHARIIKDQHALIERSEAIHRALTGVAARHGNLADLAGVLTQLLERDVAFVGIDGALLGAADASPARQARERRYMQRMRHRFPGHPSAAVQPLHIEPQGELGVARRIGCPISVNQALAAVVWLDEGPAPLGELDVRAAEHAAVVAALHLGHLHALSIQEQRLGYSLLESLLEGSFQDTPAALERARLYGWDPDASYTACLALLDEPLPLSRQGFQRRERWAARLRDHLQAAHEAPLLYASTNQVFFLLPDTRAPDALWQALAEPGMALAISRAQRGTAGMRSAGQDVLSLLPRLAPGTVLRFEHIVFPRAIQGDAQARRVFIDGRLGPLLRGRRTESLLHTLRALCDSGFQLAHTAQRLNIHISTLRYRMDRLEKLLGTSLADPRVRFELQVALEMHQSEPPAR